MLLPFLLVGIGGFFGAICRYVVTNVMKRLFLDQKPYGTMAVNLSGSFLLGLLFGLSESNEYNLLLGTGFLGAYTTFSTFKLESIQLFEKKEKNTAILFSLLTYSGGIVLTTIGIIGGKIIKGA
ncbi:CrcB protein [Cytobacillus eiseniae]|uniref:Fluoride-specific ion channel FluC n=1 Tax=Cytobacillus eiseniae TaxID=762947 RepID=A0ABS4RBL5_9BACI|nr:fluoride efflux transporter CrcB [Cytobacillus eiseniae]MBP2239745.1 CrcB protein [Cytobacillus eiseniae]